MTNNSANAEIILQVLSSLQHLMPRLWRSVQLSKTLPVCSQTMHKGGYTRKTFAKPSEEGSCTDFLLCSQQVLSPKHTPQELWKDQAAFHSSGPLGQMFLPRQCKNML